MEDQELESGVARLLRIAAALWIAYLVALAAIDRLLVSRAAFVPWYYVINALNALLLLGLGVRTWIQKWLGRTLLPLAIDLMSVLPIVIHHLMPRSAVTSAEGMVLRLMPVLLMALVITAWQYRWGHVVLFSLGTTGLTLGLIVLRNPTVADFLAALWVMVIQTISFLAVGYLIRFLARQLRAQWTTLRGASTQLTHYASTLEHLTVSRERNRVARALQDTLSHTLTEVAAQLASIQSNWDANPDVARDMLDGLLAETRASLQSARGALEVLPASPLDDLGLGLTIRQLAESAAEQANLALDLFVSESIPILSPDVEQCVYQVAQEALANVVQHANAQCLTVHLTFSGDSVSLMVRDDGTGFDVQQGDQPGQFGLSGMREWARLVGGGLIVDSQPVEGTTIRLMT
jgi:signal transduction histidine kinase